MFLSFSQLDLFPKIDFRFSYPGLFTSMTIEIGAKTDYKLMADFLEESSKSKITYNYNILIYSYKDLFDIANIISIFQNKRYRYLAVSVLLMNDCDKHIFEPFVTSGVINKLKYLKSLPDNNINKNSIVSSCDSISFDRMVINMDFYSECINFNSCLNRKISIDAQGNIKNCPSCTQSFGNIKDTTLKQALEHPDFKKFWSITKDQIDVCKDCEFRYMCTDCRVYIKDPVNIYSQPSKCTYNPYIAKWQGEEGYVPVEECGTYSRETGFVINHKRVAELNAQIWGE